jgi:hypothetical protein
MPDSRYDDRAFSITDVIDDPVISNSDSIGRVAQFLRVQATRVFTDLIELINDPLPKHCGHASQLPVCTGCNPDLVTFHDVLNVHDAQVDDQAEVNGGPRLLVPFEYCVSYRPDSVGRPAVPPFSIATAGNLVPGQEAHVTCGSLRKLELHATPGGRTISFLAKIEAQLRFRASITAVRTKPAAFLDRLPAFLPLICWGCFNGDTNCPTTRFSCLVREEPGKRPG